MRHPLAAPLRAALVGQIRALPGDDVAVLLSGGFDSWSLMFSARDAGKKVHPYVFRMQGVDSTDYQRAIEGCLLHGFDAPVVQQLSPVPGYLIERVTWMKHVLGVRKKAEIECVYPIAETMRAVREHYVLMGHGADDLYGTTKRAMLHYRNDLRAFRRDELARSQNQIDAIGRLLSLTGQVPVMPYESAVLGALFDAYETIESLHKPKLKQPTRDAFPEMEGMGLVRQGLQVGDSGIRDAFEALLDTPYNVTKARSAVAIYNRL